MLELTLHLLELMILLMYKYNDKVMCRSPFDLAKYAKTHASTTLGYSIGNAKLYSVFLFLMCSSCELQKDRKNKV